MKILSEIFRFWLGLPYIFFRSSPSCFLIILISCCMSTILLPSPSRLCLLFIRPLLGELGVPWELGELERRSFLICSKIGFFDDIKISLSTSIVRPERKWYVSNYFWREMSAQIWITTHQIHPNKCTLTFVTFNGILD